MSINKRKETIFKRKNLIFKIVLILLVLSVVYAIIMLTRAPSGVSNKEYELVKTDYVLMILQCVVGIIVIFLPHRVEKLFNVEIPDMMEIIYFIFLFCAIYLGEVQNFYYRIPFWDNILHGFSSIMLGALGFVIVDFLNYKVKSKLQLSPFFVSLFAFCFAITCGVIWEIYEYLADHVLGTNMQKFMTAHGDILVGHDALGDTMEDLIINFFGALIIVILGYIHLKRQQNGLKYMENKTNQ
ncbi:hypothetical protein ACWN8V_01405 [Vagococcus elongatus]|uniref:DUF2238 domain-containing protein n=1 Tax=Vagococcus elongatus TaxID=180344 RepID=A0A430B613_9ENTE|nr:hypothetical protein [Vagococcus elongatus]RSU15751.1 hypothetical protein CBF29_01380 [Vagococcus elongatus]